jgi:hypothetical protein
LNIAVLNNRRVIDNDPVNVIARGGQNQKLERILDGGGFGRVDADQDDVGATSWSKPPKVWAAQRVRAAGRRHREGIFRRGGIGGIFDDLADDGCYPHVVEEVERECIRAKALANPEVLIFLN